MSDIFKLNSNNVKTDCTPTLRNYMENTKSIPNPLAQFEVVESWYVTNISIIIIAVLSVVALIIIYYNFRVTSVLSMVIQSLFSLIGSIQRETLALTRQYFFQSTFYVFMFILVSNLSGLSPFAFTVTSSGVVTFFLSSTFFILINIVGIYNLKWDMVNLFLPSGTPLPIIPSLTVIELISYIARAFSLAIRLFANMMSGHALLKILIGFAFAMFASRSIIVMVLGFIPWGVVNAIVSLETLIAFLQAYVFVVLLTLYIADIIVKH